MTKTFLTKLMQHSMLLTLAMAMGLFAIPSKAVLVCSSFSTPTPVVPLVKVLPGLCDNTDPGTLLASITAEPWVSSTGVNQGTLTTAVYREAGTGTLDFYYQVTVSSTCAHPDPSSGTCDSILRNTDINFAGFDTGTAFRTDCGTFPCGAGFTDGTVAPFTADRNSASTVGFDFTLPILSPGLTSNVMVITTNATQFTAGFTNLIDGGVTTVAAFQPTAVPEPMSFILLGTGLLGLGLLRRKNQKA